MVQLDPSVLQLDLNRPAIGDRRRTLFHHRRRSRATGRAGRAATVCRWTDAVGKGGAETRADLVEVDPILWSTWSGHARNQSREIELNHLVEDRLGAAIAA